MHECVYDHIIEMLAMTNDPTARNLRRVLKQQQPSMTEESSPCTTPSEAEMKIFVSILMNDAKDKFIASGFDLESTILDELLGECILRSCHHLFLTDVLRCEWLPI